MTDTPRSPDEGRSSRYWYAGDDSAITLLSALRIFRMADQDLRRRISEGMDMNTTDVAALRFVIAHELSADPVTPRRLAENLRISGASTSKLLDRLTASGHLVRVPHPQDGRSRIVIATDHAHSQVRERLGRMHERMLEIAQQVPAPARAATIAFLLAMAEQLDTEAAPPGLTPREA